MMRFKVDIKLEVSRIKLKLDVAFNLDLLTFNLMMAKVFFSSGVALILHCTLE